MSRRLIACLVTIFLLIISCILVLAQGSLPPLPGTGTPGHAGMAPAPPPPPESSVSQQSSQSSRQGGYPQQSNIPGDGMTPGQNPAPGSSSVSAGQDDESPAIDYEASPKLKIGSMSPTLSENWTMFGKDTTHACFAPDNLSFPLKLAWKFVTKQSAEYPTSPVIADGIIYFCTNSRLYAMNAETGMLYWKYPSRDPIMSGITVPPCVGSDLVYFGSGDGTLYAVRKTDGEHVWSFKAEGAISSPPVLSDGILFVGSSDHRLYTLNAETGDPLWKGGFVTRDSIVGAPMVSGGLVYFLSNEMKMYAALVSTGQIKWWTTVGSTSQASNLVLGDDLIFLTTGGMMQAFEKQNGYKKWSFTLPGDATSIPVYADGSLYFACSDHKLYAVTSNGKAKWKSPVDLTVSSLDNITDPSDLDKQREERELQTVSAFSTPVVAGNTLIIGGSKGTIIAVDTETGTVKWTYTVLPSYLDSGKYEYVNMTSSMVVYNGTLYTFSDDGTLLAFRSNIVDNTPPEVSLVFPLRDSLHPGVGTITIAAMVSDEESGINWNTVVLRFDGKLVNYESKPERGLIWYNRKVSEVGRIEPLADGKHLVSLSLSDWAGNKTDMSWSFNVDNRLTAPADESDQSNQNQNQNQDQNHNRPGGFGSGRFGGRGVGPGMGGPGMRPGF